MKIHVKARSFEKTVNLKGRTVADLFEQLDLLDENYVTTRDGRIILWDEELKNNDTLKLYSATSG